MKRRIYCVSFAVLGLVACGSDDEDTGRDPAECDSIADQIRAVADRDPGLDN